MAGPTIARAEIDVDLDGSAIPRQARRIAQASATAFGKRWETRVKPALLRATKRMDPDLRHAWANVFRAVGATAADAMRAGFERAGGTALVRAVDRQLVRLERRVTTWGRGLTRQFDRIWTSVADTGRDAWRTLGNEVAKQTSRVRVETRGLGASIANTLVNMRELIAPGLWEKWGNTARHHLNDVRAQTMRFGEDARTFARRTKSAVDTVSESFRNLGRRLAGSRVGQSLTELGKAYRTRFRKIGEDSGTEFSEGMDRSVRRGLRGTRRTVERELGTSVRRVDREFVGLFGRMKGARNDFVNLVGIIGGAFERLAIRGTTALFGKLGDAISKVGESVAGLGPAGGIFDKLGNGIQTFGSAVSTLAGGPIGQLIVTLIGFTVTLQFLVPLMGVAVAALYTLSGAFVALSVTLGGAALGALLSLGPILGALAVGAGAAALAFFGFGEDLEKSLGPLKEWFDEAKTIAADAVFSNIENQVDGLATFLTEEFNPIIEDSGEVISDFLDDMARDFGSPKMRKILEPLQDTLPAILDNLLDITRELSTAFSGLFAAISPVVEEVTADIAEAAKAFSEWVNTKEGQDSIREFFEKTRDAADTLWDILKNVWDIIEVFFEEGNDTGQKFLDTIEDLTKEFAEWLGTDEGRKQLNDWFGSAEELADKLYEIMSSLQDLFDELNTPTNRRLFFLILDGVNALIEGMTTLADKFDTAATNIESFLATVQSTDWVQLGKDTIQGFIDGLEEKWDALWAWWGAKWDSFVTWFKDFFGISSPSTLFEGFGEDILEGLLNGLKQAWVNVVTWLDGLPNRIRATMGGAGAWLITHGRNIMSGLRVGITTRWNAILTWFNGLPGRIRATFTGALSWLIVQGRNIMSGLRTGIITRYQAVETWFDGMPARLRQNFTTAALWLIVQGRNIISGLRTGITSRWNAVESWFNGLPGRVRNLIPNASTWLVETGRQIVTGLMVGIREKWNDAVNMVSNLGAALEAGAKKALGISSPSRVFADIGDDVVAGLAQGIARSTGLATSAVNTLAGQIAAPFATTNPGASGLSGQVVGGNTRTVIVQPGAIQYTTPLSDPRLVAMQSLDELVVRIGR